MAFLVTAGTTVSVAEGGATVEYTTIGDSARAFDGTMRSTVRTRKRTWTIKTTPMTQAVRDTLYTALTGTPPIACSGDLTGSTNCVPEITNEEYVMGASANLIVLTFKLDEV